MSETTSDVYFGHFTDKTIIDQLNQAHVSSQCDCLTGGRLAATVSLLCLFLVDGRALMLIVNFCILIRKRQKVILCICMHSGRTFFLPYV